MKMKLKRNSKAARAMKNVAIAEDISNETSEASMVKPESKSKRKKFGLFSKSKKSNPQKKKTKNNKATTPDTVNESPVRTERETAESLTYARNLLAELDMADTDTGADGEAEGMELILPSPEYEVEDEVKDEVKDEVGDEVEDEVKDEVKDEVGEEVGEENKIDPTVEVGVENDNVDANESETQPDEKPVEKSVEETNEDTTEVDDHTEEKETVTVEEEEAAVVEEQKEDDTGDKEEEDVKSDQELQVQKEPLKSAANKAVKILTAALSCTATNPEDACETYGTSLYGNSFIGSNTVDLDNMFNKKSGSEFLHDMTNVGFTLVYHKAVDDESWVGRTVNMVFRPGACSSQKIIQPAIEWNTIVGGKSNVVETKTLNILNIDAISNNNDRDATKLSSLPIPAKPPAPHQNKDVETSMSMCSLSFTPAEEEEFDCFFTITSQNGEIHLFEALNMDECFRIVAGIRYSAQRLSQILIEGNSSVLMSDFYDNSREPEELRLTQNEVLNKLSNAFLDRQ